MKNNKIFPILMLIFFVSLFVLEYQLIGIGVVMYDEYGIHENPGATLEMIKYGIIIVGIIISSIMIFSKNKNS